MKKNGNWLFRAEKKFGKYAIPNLTMWIMGLYVVGFILQMINPSLLSVFALIPELVLHGQIWRIFTFLIIPPDDTILFIITIMFYGWIGRSLEETWGSFKYNLYIFSGVLFTALGSFLAYFITGINYPVNTSNLLFTLLLAFALLYPDMEILLYFVIPLKIKWMAYFYVAIILLELVNAFRYGSWGTVICIVTSLLNFLIYYFSMKKMKRVSPAHRKRQKKYKSNVKKSNLHLVGKHKCAVCGKTSDEYPDLTFRYCSKCNGNYEYCEEHLYTHKHIK